MNTIIPPVYPSFDEMGGLLLIDKPSGITSYDVIRRLKYIYPKKKIGHAGTLDPRASGLLVVGIGKGTKQLTAIVGQDKTYEAVICIGETTDTGDRDGDIIERVVVPDNICAHVEEALISLVGAHRYTVSPYSAMKRAGVPFYKIAYDKKRRGEKFDTTSLPVREMTVYGFELISCTKSDECILVRVSFSVSSGTYIRSLAVACGAYLGYPATLESLRRVRVGDFLISNALPCPERN